MRRIFYLLDWPSRRPRADARQKTFHCKERGERKGAGRTGGRAFGAKSFMVEKTEGTEDSHGVYVYFCILFKADGFQCSKFPSIKGRTATFRTLSRL